MVKAKICRWIELALTPAIMIAGTVVGIICGLIDVARTRMGLKPWFDRYYDG